MTGGTRYRLARRRLRPAILAKNTDSSASMRSDTRESRFPLFRSHPNHVDTFHSFDIFNVDIFDFDGSSPENSATYDLVSLARVLPLPHLYEPNAGERGRYVTGSHIPPQVEQVVLRSAVSQRIWTIGFRALWLLAGA
jgi:hypothetical protein